MEFTWDPAKRLSNLHKHGVDFEDAVNFEFDTAQVEATLGANEPRLLALGWLNGRLHVVVYAIETKTVRIISLRRANNREIKSYG